MATDSASNTAGLIAGRYAVHPTRPLPGAGGGLPACVATDVAGGGPALMAVQARADAPPRAAALWALAGMTDAGVLAPLACGVAPGADGRPAQFVICRAPPGPALWPGGVPTGRPWPESMLVLRLLRPVAAALALLATRRATHRAIRPGNLFRAGDADDVTLGCAWADPPAMAQPAAFESPYVAMCPPAARGAGTVADDVYALGVVLLALACGQPPLAGLSDAAVVARKLELGCFAALTGGARLSPLLTDLLSGMLASDPLHRPTPELLADPAAARARRIATRPLRRAAQALQVEDVTVWNARMLAYAVGRHPGPAARMVRIGVVDHWLRRGLNDAVLAGRLEESMRQRVDASGPLADSWLALRIVLLLDPLAPLVWRGVALWPDGLGPALAATTGEGEGGEARRRLGEVIGQEVIGVWASSRPEHCDAPALRQQARDHRATARERGWAGGLTRLCYALNPLLPCHGPTLGGMAVVALEDVLPALDAVAAREAERRLLPLDRDLGGFIAARLGGLGDNDLAALSDTTPPADAVVGQARALARLQAHLSAPPAPRLAHWLLATAAPLLERWRSRTRKAAQQALLQERADAGDLTRLVAALDDAAERRADAEGLGAAELAARRIDAELADTAAGLARRIEAGRRLGQECAAALALAALVLAAIAVALR